MNVAGVILSVGPEPRLPAAGNRRKTSRTAELAAAALGAGLAEVVVVIDDEARARLVSDAVTVLLDEGSSQASALRSAIDWCARGGYEAIVLATLDTPVPGGDVARSSEFWRALAATSIGSLVVGTHAGRHTGLFRIEADLWPILPLDGRVVHGLSSRIEQLRELNLDGTDPHDTANRSTLDSQSTSPTGASPVAAVPTGVSGAAGGPGAVEDVRRVAQLLGRPPSGGFSVVVRDALGDPVVICNEPFLDDGTPMPTRYWLVGSAEQEAVGRLESAGGVRRIEALFDPGVIAETHERYAAERDALIGADVDGPRPSGGVGGTRRGIKCLHAHLAWYLAGGGDPIGRRVAHEIAGEISGPVGAIDCGTNSTRLLVLDRDGSVLAREMIITRLGEGVDTNHQLADAAIQRTLDALGHFRAELDRFGVVRCRATTTSAARDARNRDLLFRPASEILGFDLELLEGEEEGRLSFRGATARLDLERGPVLVVDVGGGSTEFAAGSVHEADRLAGVASLDIGCVRVTERFFASDPPGTSELDQASKAVISMLDRLEADRPELFEPKVLVGVAGTVATLATRAVGLAEYDGDKTHGVVIARAFVESELELLASMRAADRRQLPGIDPARADVIVGGVLVVARVLERFGFDELIYSERDILDGLAESLL